MIQRLLRVCIVVLLAACGSGSDPPAPGPFTITPTSAWSGNVVEVRGPGAAGLTGAQLDVGPLTLPLARINDTTLSTTLPDTISAYSKSPCANGESSALGQITVHGFVQSFEYSRSRRSGVRRRLIRGRQGSCWERPIRRSSSLTWTPRP